MTKVSTSATCDFLTEEYTNIGTGNIIQISAGVGHIHGSVRCAVSASMAEDVLGALIQECYRYADLLELMGHPFDLDVSSNVSARVVKRDRGPIEDFLIDQNELEL